MTSTRTPTPPVPVPVGPGRIGRAGRRSGTADFAEVFTQLYRAAFDAAHAELGNRVAAEEIARSTLARAHARWSAIGASPVDWVCAVARTQAQESLRHLPSGPEVLLDDEPRLRTGEIPLPTPADLAAVTRRGTWLRRRRLAGRVAAGLCVLAAVVLILGLDRSLPQAPRGLSTPTAAVVATRHAAIPVRPWNVPGLVFGRISAGAGEPGTSRVTFEPYSYDRELTPAERIGPDPTGAAEQLQIAPDATLLARDHQEAQPPGRSGLVSWTPEALLINLDRFTPGGQTYVWIRLDTDGRISSLREE